MNNFKSCIPCVCTGSGRKRVCEEHDISNLVENFEKLEFSAKTANEFSTIKFCKFYMWFYNGVKVNILATTQKTAVALINKINPKQITTINAENTENSLDSVSNTIENIQFKNREIFSPIVKAKLALFSSATAIVTQIV